MSLALLAVSPDNKYIIPPAAAAGLRGVKCGEVLPLGFLQNFKNSSKSFFVWSTRIFSRPLINVSYTVHPIDYVLVHVIQRL